MSERMTGISLPAVRDSGMLHGWQDYGRKTRAEMIAQYREIAERARDAVEKILAADDADFVVETYLGPIATRKREPVE